VHFEHADDVAAAIDNMEGAELLGTCLPSFLPPSSLPPSLSFFFFLPLNLLVGDGISPLFNVIVEIYILHFSLPPSFSLRPRPQV